MSTSRYGKRLRKCSGRWRRGFRKQQPDASRRGALRRHFELASDVAPLLCQAAKAVGIALDLVDMQISLLVQRPEQFAHAREHCREIGRLLILRVGAFADMDIDPVTGELLLGKRSAAGEPVAAPRFSWRRGE